LYRGAVTGTYTENITVGNVLTAPWDLDPTKSYYIAATAYDKNVPIPRESAFSNEILCHPITWTVGAGGTASPTKPVFFAEASKQVVFTITPNSGYTVDKITINGSTVTGTTVGTVTTYTMPNVPGKTAAAVTFKAVPPPAVPTNIHIER
jgi:hypothetical protein